MVSTERDRLTAGCPRRWDRWRRMLGHHHEGVQHWTPRPIDRWWVGYWSDVGAF